MQCEISRLFFEMLSAITTEQRMPREYCGGQVLYRAELNLLEKIDQYPNLNVSKLSEKSGVTKSAVTQMTVKLLGKGLIVRYQNPANKKEKYFRLTEEGRKVRNVHAQYNRMAAEELRSFLCSLNEDDKRVIVKFMEMMKQYMPLCAFPCRCAAEEKACFLAEKRKGMEEPC